MKILAEMYLQTLKNWLPFGSHLLLDSDPGSVMKDFSKHCEMRHFQRFGSFFGKTDWMFVKILPQTYL